MGVRIFPGARYLPIFPKDWDAETAYEELSAVQVNGFTYLSKCPVPAGVPIDNEDFWMLWADPNAQMERLRQTVLTYDGRISGAEEAAEAAEAAAAQAKTEAIDAAEGFVFDNNVKTNEIMITPKLVSETSFLATPASRAQGFAMDANYYYIASNERDTATVNIVKVNRVTLEYTVNALSNTTGHGNSLTVYNNKLYVHKTSLKYDVYTTSDFTFVDSVTLQFGATALAIREIDGAPYLAEIKSGNLAFRLSRLSPTGTIEYLSTSRLASPPYCFTQGIDFTNKFVAVSYGYPENYSARYKCLPFVDLYNYNGDVINRIMVDTTEEIEDICIEGNRIYYVTGVSGHIGYVDITNAYVTSQRSCGFDWLVMSESEIPMFLSADNVSEKLTYDSNDMLTEAIIYNKWVFTDGIESRYGLLFGTGLFLGQPAMVVNRFSNITLKPLLVSRAGKLANVIDATVNYVYNPATNLLTYQDSRVVSISNGQIVVETLPDFQTRESIKARTCINNVVRLPSHAYTQDRKLPI